MKPWKRIEPTVVTKIDFHNIIVKTFELPNGKVATRATFKTEGFRGAAVIALTEDNQVVTVRQYRPGPEKVMDEIPGGIVDDGEEPDAAARRELLEESGYRPDSMMFLGTYSRDAYTNSTHYYYLAQNCKRVTEPQFDPEEFIEVKLCSIQELIDNARNNNMTDPGAVLAAYDQLRELQQKETRQ